MAMARWQSTIVDDGGLVQSAASVEVRRESDSVLVSLYTDRAGTISAGNPVLSDSEGYVYFHVAGGSYKVTATKGTFSREWRYVAVGLASETDIESDGSGGVLLDGPIAAINLEESTDYSIPGYSFNDIGVFYLPVFGVGPVFDEFHYAFTITGNSNPVGPGSLTGLGVLQYATGRTSDDYITAGFFHAATAPLSTSDSGRYFGLNPQVEIGGGLTVTQAVAMEADLIVDSTVFFKEGIRVADNSTAGGSTVDTAFNAVKFLGKWGFDYLIHAGEEVGGSPLDWDSLFPVRAGGTLFYARNDTIALANGIDLSDCGGGFSDSAFKSPGFSVDGVGKVVASAGPDPHIFSTLNASGAAFKISNFGTGQTVLRIDNDTINRQTMVAFQNDGVDAYFVGKDTTGEFVVYDVINAKFLMKLTNTSTATQTALQIYDVDNNTFERVTVGAADSGGAGFKVLRIPN